jgi:hypothetical protein
VSYDECPVWAVEEDVGLNNYVVKEFDNPKHAAVFFVKRRHELNLGLDLERN